MSANLPAKHRACYETHKPLKIGEFEIFGGSCYLPRLEADIFVGFDSGMHAMQTFPWEKKLSFLYPIIDGSIPANKKSFDGLIDFLIESLYSKKKVHIGCIGGHGRTGLVLAVLVERILGEKDAVKYVRDNYCPKAVETTSQIEWLGTHYGIKYAEPSKRRQEFVYPENYKNRQSVRSQAWVSKDEEHVKKVNPSSSLGSIWQKNI